MKKRILAVLLVLCMMLSVTPTALADGTATVYIAGEAYTGAEGETKYNFSTPVTSDLTLTAKWSEKIDPPDQPEHPDAPNPPTPPVPTLPVVPSYTVSTTQTAGGDVRVSVRGAEAGQTVVITVAPDAGFELDSLRVTDSRGNAVELTQLGENRFSFTMPRGQVKISASFVESEYELPYADAVQWAVENGITAGMTATTFGGDTNCTRAHLATFLYRYCGE